MTDDGVAIIHPFFDQRGQSGLPPTWTAAHVEVRLADAFDVLRCIEGRRLFPAAFGSGWPEMVTEWEDLINRFDPASEDDEIKIRRRANPAEIAAMDQAIQWPMRYLKDHQLWGRAMLRYSLAKAVGIPLARAAERLGYSERHLCRLADSGFSRISVGLDCDGVPVT